MVVKERLRGESMVDHRHPSSLCCPSQQRNPDSQDGVALWHSVVMPMDLELWGRGYSPP